jgi:hypothetical protein
VLVKQQAALLVPALRWRVRIPVGRLLAAPNGNPLSQAESPSRPAGSPDEPPVDGAVYAECPGRDRGFHAKRFSGDVSVVP